MLHEKILPRNSETLPALRQSRPDEKSLASRLTRHLSQPSSGTGTLHESHRISLQLGSAFPFPPDY